MPDAQIIEFPTLTDDTPKPLVCKVCQGLWFRATVAVNTDGRVVGHRALLICDRCGEITHA